MISMKEKSMYVAAILAAIYLLISSIMMQEMNVESTIDIVLKVVAYATILLPVIDIWKENI